MTAQLPFTFFDCDNHYYEALDAFTRHIDPQYKNARSSGLSCDGRQRLLVGGRVNRFIPNPTFDPVGKPGALDEYFRGRNPKGADLMHFSVIWSRSPRRTGTAMRGWL